MRIRTKLTLTFLSVISVMVAVIGFFALNIIEKDLRANAADQVSRLAELEEGTIYAYLDFIELRTVDFSSDGLIGDKLEEIAKTGSPAAAESLNAHLKNKKLLNGGIVGIEVIDLNGRIVASTDGDEIGSDESEDNYFLNGKKGVYITEERHRHFDANQSLIVSAPVIDHETNETVGVLVIYFTHDKLTMMLSGEFQLKKGAQSAYKSLEISETYVFNRYKELVTYYSPESERHAVSMMAADSLYPVKECLENDREIVGEYVNHVGKDVIGASMCIRSLGWTLMAESRLETISMALDKVTFTIAAVAAVFLLITAVFSFLISHSISKQILKLKEAADNISRGNLSTRVEVKTKDELRDLAEVFDNMRYSLKRIIEEYELLENKNVSLSKRELSIFKEKEGLSELILNSIPLGVDVVDEKCSILFMNKAFSDAFGKESLGKRCYEVYKENKKQCAGCPVKLKLKPGEIKSIIVPGIVGGKTFKITHIALSRLNGKKVFMEFFEDVTKENGKNKKTSRA